jgi:hypothetical protein
MTVFRQECNMVPGVGCRRVAAWAIRWAFLPGVLVTILPKEVGRATQVSDTSSQGWSKASDGAFARANGRDRKRRQVRVEREA